MSSQIKQYDINFFYSVQHKVHYELPVSVMKKLNLSTKIKATMNEKDLKIFNRCLDNFDAPTLKKKIKSLMNKLAEANIDGVYQKVSEILKNRKVLIEYTIKQIMVNVLEMPMLVDVYADFIKRLYTEKSGEILQSTIRETMGLLNGKVDSSKINSAEDYGKFLDYLADKSKYTAIHYLLVSLNKLKIITDDEIKGQLDTLEETIINSTPEQNDKYCETYIKVLNKMKTQRFININKIKEIIAAKVVSMRLKFALYDVLDAKKCDYCGTCKNCVRLAKAKKN